MTKKKDKIDLVVKGYHIHHSVWGFLAICYAIFFAGSVAMAVGAVGFGLGNLWQHKNTHNRMNERGMVFIEKISKDTWDFL